MAPKDLDKLIEKYLEGNCTPAERDFIETWYTSLGTERLSSPVTDDDLAETGDRILQHIGERTAGAGSHPEQHARWYYSGIAASVLILLAAIYHFSVPKNERDDALAAASPSFTEFTNDNPDSQRAVLPDGSIVLISPASTIRYLSATADSGPRELLLEGEAYFDVAHDRKRPFFVYTGDVVTRVLGTSFIIRNRGGNEKITVSVKTGKVTVYSRKTSYKKTVLTPNQEATYDSARDLLETQLADSPAYEEKRKLTTEMHFEETPIPEVFAVLIDTYGIAIDFPTEVVAKCVLTSSFYEEGLYDRIEAICTAIGATYEVVEARIVIESDGCNLKPNSL